MSNGVVNSLSVDLKNNVYGGISSASKKKWDESFWGEQKKFDQYINISNTDKNNRRTRLVIEPLAEVVAAIPAHIESHNNVSRGTQSQANVLDVVGIPQLQKGSFATVNSSQLSVIPSAYIESKPVANKVNLSSDPATWPVFSGEQLRRSLLVVESTFVSIWFGQSQGRESEKMVNQLQKALDWFGLKLKKLVVQGKEMSLLSPIPKKNMRGTE